MWRTGERPWAVHAPRFVSDELDPAHAAGPWYGHRFFAFDLITWGHPEVIVELGTHYGVSFFAFCQAVRDARYDATLHAIDTWEGDPHAGEYGDEVLEHVERARAQLFAGVDVRLHRSFFRDALNEFDDGSIDLLHIDGFHTYDAVKDDYESWLPKLADGGVVLFHDVADWARYGSAQFWREVSARHPSLTFDHSFGLGVLLPKGVERLEYLLSDEFGRWRSYYEARARAFLGELQVKDQTVMIDERDAFIRQLEQQNVGLRAEAEAARRDVVASRAVAVEAKASTAAATSPPPLSDGRRVLRTLVRLLRRGARASNRHLGTNLRLGSERLEIDDRMAAVFDAEYYLRRYPDIALAAVDPLDHYRQGGWVEGRDPSPLFWTEWYLKRYPDVAEAACEPLQYHLEIGWRAGHDPSPLLRTMWYLDRHPEIRTGGRSPLEHYWTNGYTTGEYANPEQRRRLIAAPSPARPVRRTVSECELRSPGASARLVTLDAIARADVGLVTFDLWDTLVARSRPADAPKLATARRIWLLHGRDLRDPLSPWELFAHRVATEAEIAASTEHQEYRLDDVLTQHLTAVLDVGSRAARRLAGDLAAEEAAEESRCTYRIDALSDTVDRLASRDPAPALAVLSDFYLGGDDLRAVVAATGAAHPEIDLLVSCDVDASKRVDGSLFALARERAGVEASRHLHVGDNPWSDGEQQVATGGLAAVIQLTPSPFPEPGALDQGHLRALVDEQRDELLSMVDVLAAGAERRDTDRRAAHAGVLTALLPVSLVAAAVEEALCRGVPTVHYLSREGGFLRRLHDVVAPVLAGATAAPSARHIEVSRRSTFGPSLDRVEHGTLSLMWSQYADQSPRALFESLGVAIDHVVGAAIDELGLSLDAVVPHVADDERVAALLERTDVQRHVDDTLHRRRHALDAYLRQEMDLSRSELLVVDVGWRGTIQDNLARMLGDHQLHGLYLGLFPFLNPQPPNVTKRGVAFDANADDPFVHVSPPAAIEAPLTPDVPSAVDYELRADGRASVVREHEGPRASSEIRAFQAGVLAAAPRLADWMVVNGLTSIMLKRELGELVSEYYGHPEGGVADIWFGSTHDDTFGALNVTPYEKEPPPRSVLSNVATAEVITEEARRSNWVPGYWAWYAVRALDVLRDMWRELH